MKPAIIVIAIIVLATSCSSVRKSTHNSKQEATTSTETKKDSTADKTLEAAIVRTDNSSTVTKEDSAYERKTIKEETEYTLPAADTNRKVPSTPVDQENYFPPGTKVKKVKTTTWEKGNKKKEEQQHLAKSDSSAVKEAKKISKSESSKADSTGKSAVVDKQVKRTRLFNYWWVLLLVAAGWFGWRWYKRNTGWTLLSKK